MTKQELRQMVKEEIEKMKLESKKPTVAKKSRVQPKSRIKEDKKVVETKKLIKGSLKKKLVETKLADLNGRWEFHSSLIQDMEEMLEDQDPNMLTFPHTMYIMQDSEEEGFAHAALSTDGDESFISITDYNDDEVFYKSYKDWKLALTAFKKIVKASKVKGRANGKPIVF
jgi:hypothetical protein